VIPPVTGDYRFAIAGDNECELWLSDSDLKYNRTRIASVRLRTAFRDWFDPKEPKQMSLPVRLEAGKRYYIEALHHQAEDGSYVSVAWKVPGKADFEVIEGKALAAFDRDSNDLDDDDLPDDWEKANGSPANLANGNQDSDGDGLTNRQEYLLGTRADKADTDGDGVSDFDEVQFYHSNPLRKDVAPSVKVADIPPGNYHSSSDTWTLMPDGAIRSLTRQGSAEFSFTVDRPGIYQVDLQANARSFTASNPFVAVVVLVDGKAIGRTEVHAQGTTTHWFTPVLAAGSHSVSIDHVVARSGVSLVISALSIYQPQGEDQNQDGMADWLDRLVQTQSRMLHVPIESATSPVCLEGVERFPGDAQISSDGQELPVQPGLARHWYVDVPLNPTDGTHVAGIFENGSVREEHTITWMPTNLFSAPEIIRVRAGDSLKLIAVPAEGDNQQALVTITRDEESLGEAAPEKPLVVKFDKAGTFTLAAHASVGGKIVEVTVRVEVVSADFGPEFSVSSGAPREWDLPNIPRSVLLETDAELSLTEHEREAPETRRFTVNYVDGQAGSPRVLARLGTDGPVVAATNVNAFNFVRASINGGGSLVDTLSDGTRVIAVRYFIVGKIPKDLSVWIEIYITGTVFADGSAWHELTAADFDAHGVAQLLFYGAPTSGRHAFCHFVRAYMKDPAGR
jgi:hypothetical protein